MHPSGEWPDRCIWRVDNGKPRGWCRQCGTTFWPDGDSHLPDPEELERWRKEREEIEIRRKRSAEHALELLQQEKAWLRYHSQLDLASRHLWETWGIPEYFQDYWKLGYDPRHEVWTGEAAHYTPSMTIPIYEPKTWKVLNIRHRLLDPPTNGDKYRPERAGLRQSLFVAYPDAPIAHDTLIVEGEKKAMVSFIAAGDGGPLFQVVGIQGKNMGAHLVDQMVKAYPVYICLDPDAEGEADQLAQKLGRGRCRIVRLPEKIDDAIIDYGLGADWMKNILQSARPA